MRTTESYAAEPKPYWNVGSESQRFLPEQGNKLPGSSACLSFLCKTDKQEKKGDGIQKTLQVTTRQFWLQTPLGLVVGLGAAIMLIPGEAAKFNFPTVWLSNIWTWCEMRFNCLHSPWDFQPKSEHLTLQMRDSGTGISHTTTTKRYWGGGGFSRRSSG